MKIAYFECLAGAAGDMITAAMLDCGLDQNFLKDQLKTLNLGDILIEISKVKRSGLSATCFKPTCNDPQHHRNLKQITEIINKSKISTKAKHISVAIFNKLASAEAQVHGKKINEIHFHEVGAFDAIIDIVSAAIGIEALGIEKIYCSTLSLGGGTVKCAHGTLPVPAPATALLVKSLPVRLGPIDAELLTPTAAAILATAVDYFSPMPPVKILNIGCGAGTMDSDKIPNVTRLFLAQTLENSDAQADSICLMETNIDDVSGEIIASVTHQILETGALDVYTSPIYMKHSRPAVKLSVICKPDDTSTLEKIIFSQGLTFGIRKQILQRSKLSRSFETVITKFGPVKIKIGIFDNQIVNVKPEFKACLELSQKNNIPLKAILTAAMEAYNSIKK